jgi:glycine/D-amino acid oxidase-like deaminating enzyme
MKEAFEKRLQEEPEFLHNPFLSDWSHLFNYNYGIGEVAPCLLIDLNTMIKRWHQKLSEDSLIINERFEMNKCEVSDDKIIYKDITAKKIIFCDGVDGISNRYFKNLPYSPNKGEAIIAKIPGLSSAYIYKQGLSIVPWGNDLFWIGSTYEWNYVDTKPTPAFREKVINQLKFWLKLPYEIVNHIAGVRPANMERRPFVGLHPRFASVGILNGMGTKGCSLAPFFAKQLADHLVDRKEIYADADVKRFEKTLAREMN